MEAKFKVTKPENIEFSLTMTLPLSEWQTIKDQLRVDYKYPYNKLTSAVSSMVLQATATFYPERDKKMNNALEKEKNKFYTELTENLSKGKRNYEPMFSFPVAPWLRWFAWHPVYTVDRGYRWLRFVYKRPCQFKECLARGAMEVWWQYVVNKD